MNVESCVLERRFRQFRVWLKWMLGQLMGKVWIELLKRWDFVDGKTVVRCRQRDIVADGSEQLFHCPFCGKDPMTACGLQQIDDSDGGIAWRDEQWDETSGHETNNGCKVDERVRVCEHGDYLVVPTVR